MDIFIIVLRGAEVLWLQSKRAFAKNIINPFHMSGSGPTFSNSYWQD